MMDMDTWKVIFFSETFLSKWMKMLLASKAWKIWGEKFENRSKICKQIGLFCSKCCGRTDVTDLSNKHIEKCELNAPKWVGKHKCALKSWTKLLLLPPPSLQTSYSIAEAILWRIWERKNEDIYEWTLGKRRWNGHTKWWECSQKQSRGKRKC